MPTRKYYEIVYDRLGKRWVFRQQGTSNAIRAANTKAEVIAEAIAICNNQYCSLRIHLENGLFEEERTYPRSSDPTQYPG